MKPLDTAIDANIDGKWEHLMIEARPSKKSSIVCDQCGHKLPIYVLVAGTTKIGSHHYSIKVAYKRAIDLTNTSPNKFRLRALNATDLASASDDL